MTSGAASGTHRSDLRTKSTPGPDLPTSVADSEGRLSSAAAALLLQPTAVLGVPGEACRVRREAYRLRLGEANRARAAGSPRRVHPSSIPARVGFTRTARVSSPRRVHRSSIHS